MAAVCQISHNSRARDYYRKKIAEGKAKKHALRCVMKRLAMIVYGMLRNGTQYDAEYGKKQHAPAQQLRSHQKQTDQRVNVLT
jgi:hypothetical protein